MEHAERRGIAAGAALAFAAALVTAAAAAFSMPASLLHVLGPPPVPAVFGASTLPLAAVAGALAGRRAARDGSAPGRRTRVVRLVLFAYALTVSVVAAGIRVATLGAEAAVQPIQLILSGVMACLLLAPWAAVPTLAAALALEALTRRPASGGAPAPPDAGG